MELRRFDYGAVRSVGSRIAAANHARRADRYPAAGHSVSPAFPRFHRAREAGARARLDLERDGHSPRRTNLPALRRSHTVFPNQLATGPDLPNAPIFAIGGGSGSGDPNVVPTGLSILEGQKELPVPLPPAPKPQPALKQMEPVRVGGGVQAAKLIFSPKPVYPPLARQARISGTVRLIALISPDGHIRNLRLMTGHPMLAPAALAAVSQWVYKPTLLNGMPVEVLTDIKVNFVLQ